MTNKDKKTVIITGGSRGIGEDISRIFAENNYYVLIGARTDTGLAKKIGKQVHFKKADVRYEKDHQELVRAALEWSGQLDVYINCAGFSQWSPIEQVDDEFWSTMIDTNLKGTFWGCKVASQYLSKGGSIINISSLAGKRGSANNSLYCASKFAVTGLTQALAKELGKKGIRVNAVCPVYVETEALLKALSDTKSPAKGKNVKKYLKEFSQNNSALKRLPQACEIARTCLFLASEQASAITGQSINVDCGVLPQ